MFKSPFRKREKAEDRPSEPEPALPVSAPMPDESTHEASGLLAEVFSRIEPVCPYCGVVLEKMPGRKKKCPSCSNDIYVRSRPEDGKPVLVKDSEHPVVEAYRQVRRAISDGGLFEENDLPQARAALRKQFGHEPSEGDVLWRLFNDKSMELAKYRNWGLYRNLRLTMAEHLIAEQRDAAAMQMFLEVCYLDLNGPTNRGDMDPDPELESMFPIWDPERGMEPDYAASRAAGLADSASLEIDDIREKFYETARKLHASMKLPVSPEDAWSELEDYFEADEE